jgi:hypothetical protein
MFVRSIGDRSADHDGSSGFFTSLKYFLMAKMAAFALSVSKMVSISITGLHRRQPILLPVRNKHQLLHQKSMHDNRDYLHQVKEKVFYSMVRLHLQQIFVRLIQQAHMLPLQFSLQPKLIS